MEFTKPAAAIAAAFFIITAVFLIWHYYFSIYELKAVISPESGIKACSKVTVKYIPINVWGMKVVFRKPDVEFIVDNPEGLIVPGSISTEPDKFTFTAGNNPGVLVLKCKSRYFISTNILKIEIGAKNE